MQNTFEMVAADLMLCIKIIFSFFYRLDTVYGLSRIPSISISGFVQIIHKTIYFCLFYTLYGYYKFTYQEIHVCIFNINIFIIQIDNQVKHKCHWTWPSIPIITRNPNNLNTGSDVFNNKIANKVQINTYQIWKLMRFREI